MFMMRKLSRGTKVVLLAMLALLLLGGGTLVLASPTYTITNDTTINMKVNPLSKAESASAYYDYNTVYYASGNPDFGTQSGVGFFWLYENTLNGDISIGMIFDTPNDGSGGTVDMTISGVPSAGFVELVDDPKSISPNDDFTVTYGNWDWSPCCTDGGVIGGLDGLWEIVVALDTSTDAGIDQWYFLNGPSSDNPATVALNMNKDLVINSVPIPGALWLLGSGLIGLLGIRKKFRNI